MRLACLAILLLLAGPFSGAAALAASLHAGIARLTASTSPPFDLLVWYPTSADETPWQIGPFAIPASHNAAVAEGRFPVLLLSHGGGPTGGSPLLLRDLSAALARQGFIVVAPFHGKAGLSMRTLQIGQALATLRADPRFAAHVDPVRLGMLGFSLGGAVALEVAGAKPDPAHFEAYCGAHADDAMSCHHAPDGGNGRTAGAGLAVGSLPSPLPLKAMALLDPFAVPFTREGLAIVTMPVLLLRPEQSELAGAGNAFALAAALPQPPQLRAIPGTHFVFTDVCMPDLQVTSPEICRDPSGVDRMAVQAQVAAQIGVFFRASL